MQQITTQKINQLTTTLTISLNSEFNSEDYFQKLSQLSLVSNLKCVCVCVMLHWCYQSFQYSSVRIASLHSTLVASSYSPRVYLSVLWGGFNCYVLAFLFTEYFRITPAFIIFIFLDAPLFTWWDLTCNESNLLLVVKISTIPPVSGTWTYFEVLFGLLHSHTLVCLLVYVVYHMCYVFKQ